ncbi:large ribosomal subunit protein uL14m-like [Watersipora subatra]|uniref:large ribosomal subunit protein uL14m-like n=1 Tax=Watersipora subatra TaxID=2589382 RepID=UPI00355C9BE8
MLHSLKTVAQRTFSTSVSCAQVQLRTRLKVVDNSILGKEAVDRGRPAYCIGVYNKTRIGTTGDIIRVAIRGQPKKAVLVGCRQVQRHGVPRYDSNNIVLLEDNGSPSATKIRVPIPNMLKAKGKDVAKILPNASKFV